LLLDQKGLVPARYFAYGSNMNPERVRDRGIVFHLAVGARLSGFALAFDKSSKLHDGVGHANVVFAPGKNVEGVLYWLASAEEINKMDRFENTPVNYSREVVQVQIATAWRNSDLAELMTSAEWSSARVSSWTYFANSAVRKSGLVPPRSYMKHLLAGEPFLTPGYYQKLARWTCEESR